MIFFKPRRILILAFVVALVFLLSQRKIYSQSELQYGVTFSQMQANSLHLDWKQTYLAILDDLKVKRLRLPIYWDYIEGDQGKYYWNDLDWQIQEANKRKVEIILAVGNRVPRWPECHFPNWAQNMPQPEREVASLDYLKKVLERYRNEQQIIAWQIENEPFLKYFGECPPLDRSFLDQEIKLAKEITGKPIVITDSGELSLWAAAASRADIFGTTMYRDTYSKIFKSYIHYPIGPWFFKIKRNIVSFFVHPQKWVVIEMAAEPWGPIAFQDMTEADRGRTMDLQKFKDMLTFGQQSGFQEFYLWGVEWWYWEKTVNHDSTMWNEAKKLF